MNRALWNKAVSDAWRQLAVSCVVLTLFSWIFVWLMSMMQLGAWGALLNLMPSFVEPLVGVPIKELAQPTGRLSILYVHVVTLLVCVGWSVGRGSDPICGEIGRGTMDLIASLPVRRAAVLLVPAVVSTFGAVMLPASVLLGTTLGLSTFDFGGNVQMSRFLPGAINLFCMTFCLTAITALLSSFNRDRWRTISLAIGIFVVSLIAKLVGRLWQPESGVGYYLHYVLTYGSFLNAFHPQRLILMPEETGWLAPKHNLTLIGLGLLCYALAAIIFTRRDVPSA
ncbi:MAG TPA: ABC transporter permease subunit [Thermoguttaceae bacterium]|nr:ABC transporter permease subunit [Thermoguttaceae bacterium]